jgi:hypothetical protein
MNAVGIGTSVGLGTVIGLRLVVPGAPAEQYFATFALYGIFSGLIFETVRFILQKPPST